MSDDVYIVGIDMIRFGRFPEKSVPKLGAEAALLALADFFTITGAVIRARTDGYTWPLFIGSAKTWDLRFHSDSLYFTLDI